MTPDPLSSLRDWHPPDAVSWWPPAPGWWLLALAILAVLVLAARAGLGRRRQTALARATRRQLETLGRELAADGDQRRYVASLSRLLRRLALARYPRARVAGLSGDAWLAFLDATGGGGEFTRGVGRVLIESAYRPGRGQTTDIDPERLQALILAWVEANGRGGR